MKTQVYLTSKELSLLDGNCSPETQKLVDAAKIRLQWQAELPGLTEAHAEFVSRLMERATTAKRLILAGVYLKKCPVCARVGENDYCKRTERKQFGYKKGDLMGTIKIPGYELADTCVRMEGYVTLGCCSECWRIIKPYAASILADIQAEIPMTITGIPPRYMRVHPAACTECGWKGTQYEMGLLPTLMGDGRYRGACPSCKAENGLFMNRVAIDGAVSIVVKLPEMHIGVIANYPYSTTQSYLFVPVGVAAPDEMNVYRAMRNDYGQQKIMKRFTLDASNGVVPGNAHDPGFSDLAKKLTELNMPVRYWDGEKACDYHRSEEPTVPANCDDEAASITRAASANADRVL